MKRAIYALLILLASCSSDPAAPDCPTTILPDLAAPAMKITQVDDHHFFVVTDISNLSVGKCADKSAPTFATIKVYYGPDATVNEANALVEEKTFSISELKGTETRKVEWPVNFQELGHYLFVFTIDYQNVVEEANENNNTIRRSHWKQF
ncbi:MAG TPA: CARDB domain-containing protein [Chryseosolibacter sp.]